MSFLGNYASEDIEKAVEEMPNEASPAANYEHGSEMASGETVLKPRVEDVKVYIHSSQLAKVMTGNFGLSASEIEKLEEYDKRENGTFLGKKGNPLKMTPDMEDHKKELIKKRDNPDIGQTGKSYINEMVTADLYEIRKEMHSKYTAHGNFNEDHSINMLNRHLGTSFAKNVERKIDEEYMLSGECDILEPGKFVIDIKNPYDTFTFDKNRDFNITLESSGNNKLDEIQRIYWWQLQSYCHLYDVPVAYLVYTLNEHMYLEDQSAYEKFVFLDRVIVKKMVRDPNAMELYKERIPAIKNAITDAKITRLGSMAQTAFLLEEIKLNCI